MFENIDAQQQSVILISKFLHKRVQYASSTQPILSNFVLTPVKFRQLLQVKTDTCNLPAWYREEEVFLIYLILCPLLQDGSFNLHWDDACNMLFVFQF